MSVIEYVIEFVCVVVYVVFDKKGFDIVVFDVLEYFVIIDIFVVILVVNEC